MVALPPVLPYDRGPPRHPMHTAQPLLDTAFLLHSPSVHNTISLSSIFSSFSHDRTCSQIMRNKKKSLAFFYGTPSITAPYILPCSSFLTTTSPHQSHFFNFIRHSSFPFLTFPKDITIDNHDHWTVTETPVHPAVSNVYTHISKLLYGSDPLFSTVWELQRFLLRNSNGSFYSSATAQLTQDGHDHVNSRRKTPAPSSPLHAQTIILHLFLLNSLTSVTTQAILHLFLINSLTSVTTQATLPAYPGSSTAYPGINTTPRNPLPSSFGGARTG
jgi:hypothetical protein